MILAVKLLDPGTLKAFYIKGHHGFLILLLAFFLGLLLIFLFGHYLLFLQAIFIERLKSFCRNTSSDIPV